MQCQYVRGKLGYPVNEILVNLPATFSLTYIPGNQEWVFPSSTRRDGKGEGEEVGWLFKDGDVVSLTNGILHAINNREQLSAMGWAARQLAEARGNWKKNFPELLKAYEIALTA